MAASIGRVAGRRFGLLVGACLAACVVSAGTAGNSAASTQATGAQSACNRAVALLAQGYLSDAEAALKAQLGAANPCVARELGRVFTAEGARAPTPYFRSQVRAIRGLMAAGFTTQARTMAEALIAANPNRPIPPDIRAFTQRVGWWQLFLNRFGPPARTALEILIGFFAVIVVLLLAASLGVGLKRRRWPATYTIGTVTGLESADAKKQTELLKAELNGLSGNTYGESPLRRAASEEQAISLPAAVTTAVPETQLLAGLLALLDRLLPRRLTRVNLAALPPDPILGVGLTVQVATRSGQTVQEETLWENHYFPVAGGATGSTHDVGRLMLPAAVWLAYQPDLQPGGPSRLNRWLRRQYSGFREWLASWFPRWLQRWAAPFLRWLAGWIPRRLRSAYPSFERWLGGWIPGSLRRGYVRLRTRRLLHAAARGKRPRGTQSWESYAHFAVAERAQGSGNLEDARHGYFRALDDDRTNTFALLNLAGLKLYRENGGDGETDQDRLDMAKWLLCEAGKQDATSGALVALRWLYLTSAWALYSTGADRQLALPFAEALYAQLDPAYQPEGPDAVLTLPELYARLDPGGAAGAPAGYPLPGSRREQEALDRLKTRMRGPAWVLLQSARLEAQLPADVDPGVMTEWWSPNVLYNLACFYARRAAMDDAARAGLAMPTAQADLAMATKRLGEAIDRAGEPTLVRAMAAGDPVLTEVWKNMTPKPAEDPYAKDVQVGRGWGVRVHEALKSTVLGDHNGRDATAGISGGAGGHGQPAG